MAIRPSLAGKIGKAASLEPSSTGATVLACLVVIAVCAAILYLQKSIQKERVNAVA